MKPRIETKVVHAGYDPSLAHGAVVTPIYQSAMYGYGTETSYHDLKYIRLNNTPNQIVLAGKLAALENAQSAVVTASGMAAISTSMLTVLSSGDHMLVQKDLYGGTHSLVTEDLPKYGIHYSFIDPTQPSEWDSLRKPNTKAIYVEAMSNPLLRVADHQSIVSFARKHKLVSMIDNTFASPVNFRAVEFGYDLSLHSATKYLNGHSDIVAGVVIGSHHFITEITHRLNHLGGSLDPHTCFLLERGIKTLVLRVRQQNKNALALAEMLEKHPAVASVAYPGLASHPHHARAMELFDGFGGVLSFEPKGGVSAAEEFIARAHYAMKALSLGGVETLASRPAVASHSGIPRADRLTLGIGDALIRVAVGIEAEEDLVDDFRQALA